VLTRGRGIGLPPGSRPRTAGPKTIGPKAVDLKPVGPKKVGRVVAGLVPLALVSAACSGGLPRHADAPTTTSPPTSSSIAPTTTSSVTTTTAPAGFPSVIVQAMAEFSPLPAGARAPIRLPATTGDITAETAGLGGEANVTLIATTSPVTVDSPALASGAGTELASFSTTPTASESNATTEVSGDRSRSQASCQGTANATALSDGTAAGTCSTAQGEALDWMAGSWSVQVLALDGASPPMAEADHIESLIGAAGPATTALPSSGGGGAILSVVVPGGASAGSADTAALEWSVDADVYLVRSSDDPDAALAVAAAMRPYPA